MKVIFAVATLGWLLFSCHTPQEQVPHGYCLVTPSPGWVNDSTYRLRSIGRPGQEGGSLVKRRTQAEENALLCAQAVAGKLMLGESDKIMLPSSQALQSSPPQNIAVYIRGGQIVNKKYDSDDGCEIIFEISGEKLREKSGG